MPHWCRRALQSVDVVFEEMKHAVWMAVSAYFFRGRDRRLGFDFALRGILWYFHTIIQVFVDTSTASHNGCIYPKQYASTMNISVFSGTDL